MNNDLNESQTNEKKKTMLRVSVNFIRISPPNMMSPPSYETLYLYNKEVFVKHEKAPTAPDSKG